MSRVEPLTLDALAQTERAAIDAATRMMGFTANDALTMARNPALLHAFAGLVGAVYAPGKIDAALKRLIGLVTSNAAGCRYCTAHTAFAGLRHGVDEDKLADVWNFERSAQFSDAEKAALRVALLAGQSPNAVDDGAFDALGNDFDADAQLEIVAVIALFGFLNRWNSTLATDLEPEPGTALPLLGPSAG